MQSSSNAASPSAPTSRSTSRGCTPTARSPTWSGGRSSTPTPRWTSALCWVSRARRSSCSTDGKFGGNASDAIGDVQGFSNIDAASFNGIGEAWLEVKFLRDALRVKGGRIDANTEFAALHSSEEFLNSSMGYSPTIWGMPTYPNPGNGVLSGLTAGEHFDVSAGAFERIQSVDGHRQRLGWMWLGQARTKWEAPGGRDGSFSVGAWHHTGSVEQLEGGAARGATGPFATLEQTVWRERGERSATRPSRHMHLFLQYGKANALLSEVTSHVGGGHGLSCAVRQSPRRPAGRSA